MLEFMLLPDPAELTKRAAVLRAHAKETRRRPDLVLKVLLGQIPEPIDQAQAMLITDLMRIASEVDNRCLNPETLAKAFEAEANMFEQVGTFN